MDKRLMSEARRHRVIFTMMAAIAVLTGLIVIAQAALFSQIVSRAHLGGASAADLTSLLIGLGVVLVARAVLAGAITRLSGRLAATIKADLRGRLLARLVALGPTYLHGQRTGEISHLLTDGADGFDPFFRDLLPALLIAAAVPVMVVLAVLPVDLLTFAILCITAPLIPLLGALIGMAAGAQARRRHAEMGRLSAHFLDVLQGLQSLKLLNRSRPQTAIIARVTDNFREATLEVLKTAFLSAFALELLASLSIAIIAVEIGLRLLAANVSFEAGLFVLVIAPEFYTPLRTLAARFHAAEGSKAAADDAWALFDALTPVSAPPTLQAAPTTAGIHLVGVSYTYPGANTSALSGLTLDLTSGQRVALVGTSGGGKSTVAHLLMGFVPPTDGTLYLHGQDVSAANFDWEAWRANVGYVGQRPTLFSGSVRDNIRLARPSATDEEVYAAADAADAHGFIIQLPNGYDSPVGENGLRLSRGQAQRIALARAFLRDAPVWVLDEPTAHLDPESEAHILEHLDHATHGKTVLLIDHGLRAAAVMDTIISLEVGDADRV
jgi:ATP-binding cassette subfamily C protein CydD